MSRFIDFEGSNCARYSNALHVAYHKEQYDVLDSRATLEERMHVSPAKKKEYYGYIEELGDRSKEAQASIDTQETTAQDAERDRLLSMLFFLVSSNLTAIDTTMQDAAKLLNVVLTPYKGVQNKPDDEETGLVRGLLQDLRKDENQEAVSTLNLDGILTQLETANESFASKKSARRQARHSRYLQLSTEDLRKLTDETLGEIQDLIRASGIIASVTEGEADTVTFAESLINEMNGIARSYKTTLRQIEAQREAAKKKAEAEPS